MATRSRIDAAIPPLALLCMALCAAGTGAGLYVVLVRVPAVAVTKLDLLSGTLQGVAVCLLFGAVALLVNLTWMIRRAGWTPARPGPSGSASTRVGRRERLRAVSSGTSVPETGALPRAVVPRG